jgi:hypothetical protein
LKGIFGLWDQLGSAMFLDEMRISKRESQSLIQRQSCSELGTARIVLRSAGSDADMGRMVFRRPFDSLSIAVDTLQTWLL